MDQARADAEHREPNKPRPSEPKLLDWLPNVPGCRRQRLEAATSRRRGGRAAGAKARREERIEVHRFRRRRTGGRAAGSRALERND